MWSGCRYNGPGVCAVCIERVCRAGFFHARQFRSGAEDSACTWKVFDPTLPAVREVKELPEVALFCEVLQDNAQVRYRDRQITATVKGVDDTFGRLTRIDSILVDSRDGSFVLSDEVANYANLGVGTAFSLGVRPNYADPLEIYAPKRNEKSISPTLSPP